MTINMYIATVAWLLLTYGFLKRKSRTIHVPCMLSGIALDFALVIYLQLTKEAIQTAVSFNLSFWQQAHIAVSSIAMLLYLPIIFLGFKLFYKTASASQRQIHTRIGKTALLLRTCGFVLMFSMIK